MICSTKLGMRGLLCLVIPVAFLSGVTLKMPHSNHDNSKTFEAGFGLEGRKVIKLQDYWKEVSSSFGQRKFFEYLTCGYSC